jgi:uncharacterized membrane protein YhiD involved in acid resistance
VSSGLTGRRPDLLADRHRICCPGQPGWRRLAERHRGAVTGIGFIGGGIVLRRAVRTGEIISGVTTAASIFATAAIGAAAGAGLLAVAALATGLVLVALEGPHLRCSG